MNTIPSRPMGDEIFPVYINNVFVGKAKCVEVQSDADKDRPWAKPKHKINIVGMPPPAVMKAREQLKAYCEADLQALTSASLNCRCETIVTPKIEKGNSMKSKHPLALLLQGYTTIQVRFDSTNRLYTYKAKGELRAGDHVVVDSPRQGFVVAEVVSVDKKPHIDAGADFTYKWIVQRVDRTEYDAMQVQEAEFLNKMEEVECARQCETLYGQYTANLPVGSEARKVFDEAVASVKGASHE